jgi:glycosyltransferase involved in cell wall biosynthesis
MKYVVISPARNEAQFIARSIESVVAQTLLPARYVVVSDGSTDGTDEIVLRYASRYPWIRLVRTPERRQRHFAGKVHAFNAGLDAVRDVNYAAIASLDADISLDPAHFQFLTGQLATDARLGLVGAPFRDRFAYDYRFVSIEHVSGACQVFRRECFEDIGGYVPARSGGIDHIAVLTARMKGWKTRTFPEIPSTHHRDIGSAEHSVLAAKFRVGALDYRLGAHPVWQLFRTAYQVSRPPVVAGGLSLLAGYVWSAARRVERSVSPELMQFRRREQMRRLRSFIARHLRWPGTTPPRSDRGQPACC